MSKLRRLLNTLSGRFLILTMIFVMLAEIMIFVPSVARFRQDFFMLRLERAQIASLALLANDMLDEELEAELLVNADVYNVVLRRNEVRRLVLNSSIPGPVVKSFDMRGASGFELIRDAATRLLTPENEIIRVVGNPVRDGGLLIEVTMETQGLRAAMLDYGVRILVLSAVISLFTAALLFFAVRVLLVRPIEGVVGHMKRYAAAPEDARGIISPSASVTELRDAEEALHSLQTQLTQALRQRERLASLGGAVAKVSHDLRNILTSAQMFVDRIEGSEDPLVARMAPKLVGSITRAVNLCESTLAFGRVDEPPPTLARVKIADVIRDVVDSERLAVEGFNIAFIEDAPDDLMLRGDAEQLYRVLSNLVRNARQAMMNKAVEGSITLSAVETPDAWVLRVTDTGPGLPQRAQDNLFKPFEGGVSKGGTGLGLVIAGDLIRGHGGRLALDKTGPEGTQFSITLPFSDMALGQAAE